MQPPETPQHDESYEYHGERIGDPYLWLEDGDDDAVQEWVAEQNEYADAHLGDSPATERLRPRFEELAHVKAYGTVVPADGTYFQRIREPDQDHAVLYCFDEPGGQPRQLVDPNAFSEDGTVSMGWYVPSPDGSLVAYGVDEGGQENYDVHVLDVESGEDVEVLESTGRTNGANLAWKGEGFYYVATGSAGEGGQLDKELRYHELGTALDSDPVLATDFAPQDWPGPVTDPESDRVVVAVSAGWERTDLYYLDHGDDELQDLVVGEDAIFDPVVRGDDCYLQTSYGAPNYRVARLDLSAPPAVEEPGDLETVVPEDDEATLDAVAITAEHLLVRRNRDVVSELTAYDRDGGSPREVDLPGTGTVSGMQAARRTGELFFTYQSFDVPASQLRYDPAGGTVSTVSRPDVEPEVELAVDQEWFESADGTEVPAFVVRRADLEPDGSNPAVLYGYGGFDVSQTPAFKKFVLPFLADGGVFAVANLRGGGEFGEEWHHAARREHKQRTFEDFHAAAEHLVDRGWADPDRLACQGGSNGGLTVGAAITQRPDLFAACHCAVPLLDMLRFHRSLLGESWTSEYGNPETDPEAFEFIRAYSPYHNVEDRAYPAVLFTTARGDTRVDPFHARKMAARLQAHQQADDPILLRIRESTGHGTGKPVSMVVDEKLEEWGFLYEQLGVEW